MDNGGLPLAVSLQVTSADKMSHKPTSCDTGGRIRRNLANKS